MGSDFAVQKLTEIKATTYTAATIQATVFSFELNALQQTVHIRNRTSLQR